MTAIAVCRTCGIEPREGARFCDGCGAPVMAHHTHAEYKQVTVLFADVVHSMDIAAAVGAERLREIVAGLVNRAAVVVKRYGGTVDKFTGDGIMAVFGAPVALEDHAVRACMAALRVQEEAKRLAVEIRERDAVDLQLRAGLNSGQVIAGEIGSGALGYTAVSLQLGMAQLMESVAPPSDDTQRIHRAASGELRRAGCLARTMEARATTTWRARTARYDRVRQRVLCPRLGAPDWLLRTTPTGSLHPCDVLAADGVEPKQEVLE